MRCAVPSDLNLSRIFRLAGPCIQSKCANWENQACGLIGRMRQEVDRRQLATEPDDKLPRCGDSLRLRLVATDGAGGPVGFVRM